MPELWVYHLERTTLEHVLPELLEKVLQRGWRAVVQVGSDARADALDQALWTYRDDSFLPHGTTREPHPEDQPVLIGTTGESLNQADVLIVAEAAEPLAPERIARFERSILIFDGGDTEALTAARAAWKGARDAGLGTSYWQQSAGGKWEKKA